MSHFSVFVTVPQMNPAAPIHVDELEDRVATIERRTRNKALPGTTEEGDDDE